MRYTLIGGHSAGRVVEFDGPAPPFVAVAYRVPLTLDEAGPLGWADCLLGIERYDLIYHRVAHGPPVPLYVCPDLRK